MDLHQLQNFLIIAQEENMTHAADYLHISQPTLSRQVKALETEFGKPLLYRESKKVTLTQDGVLLRKRATEILHLVDKTTDELTTSHQELSGDILLGVSETDAIKDISQRAAHLIEQNPKVTLKLRNGDNHAILGMVNNGIVDLGLYFGQVDSSTFNAIRFPEANRYVAIMPRQHPLATKTVLTPNDLLHQSLILYQAALDDHSLSEWFQREISELHVAGTFGMYLSAQKMVEGGLGIALVLDNLVDYHDTNLVCRPISPEITVNVSLIWKKYQVFSDTAQAFLNLIKTGER